MNTREEILSIASDLREGSMTTDEAISQLHNLLHGDNNISHREYQKRHLQFNLELSATSVLEQKVKDQQAIIDDSWHSTKRYPPSESDANKDGKVYFANLDVAPPKSYKDVINGSHGGYVWKKIKDE